MSRAESLAHVVADMPPGCAREVVRATLKAWSAADVADWHRMKDNERKQIKRDEKKSADHFAASGKMVDVRSGTINVTGQVPVSVEGSNRTSSGLVENAEPETPSPAGSHGFPNPSLTPNPHPTPYSPPPSQPEASPSAPVESEEDRQKQEATEREKAERKKLLHDQCLAVAKIMHRREGSKWTDREKSAFKKQFPLNPDDLAAVADRYAKNWPPSRENYLRHDLVTLMNNWPGEVDKARRLPAKPPNGHNGHNEPFRPKRCL